MNSNWLPNCRDCTRYQGIGTTPPHAGICEIGRHKVNAKDQCSIDKFKICEGQQT